MFTSILYFIYYNLCEYLTNTPLPGFYATGAGLADLYLDQAGLTNILMKFGLEHSITCCADPNSSTKQTPVLPEQTVTCALLSGNGNYENRRFEGARANYLMSSPLALLLASVGSVRVDLTGDTLTFKDGQVVTISDIWPDRDQLIRLE